MSRFAHRQRREAAAMRPNAIFVLALLIAALVWSALVCALLRWLALPAPPSAPLTLEARFVEMPPPAPPAAPAAQPRHATLATPRPIAQPRARATPGRASHARTAQAIPQAHVSTPPGSAVSSPPQQSQTAAADSSPSIHSTRQAESASSESEESQESQQGAARPLLQPLPVLPDDLREYAYQAIALARFTIHPDGSVDVVLIKPTQNPRLNQLLLATLRNWRFFPATKKGRPIESEQDIRVHFNVE